MLSCCYKALDGTKLSSWLTEWLRDRRNNLKELNPFLDMLYVWILLERWKFVLFRLKQIDVLSM